MAWGGAGVGGRRVLLALKLRKTKLKNGGGECPNAAVRRTSTRRKRKGNSRGK